MKLGRVVGFVLGAVLATGIALFVFTNFPILERIARTRVIGGSSEG